MEVVKWVNSKSSHLKEKINSFFPHFFLLYQYEMMDVNKTYCGNHFMTYVSQTFMLYTWNSYKDACQLYLKTGKK